jgi:hypothetical protein
MDERSYVFVTLAVIVGYLLLEVARKKFDPFAPVWMFLTGYLQVYVIQALSYHEYAIRVRGIEITTLANTRALWALCWFLLIYQIPFGRLFASKLPRAPMGWSVGVIGWMTPVLVLWGLAGAVLISHDSTRQGAEVSQEAFILLQFPILMLVAAILLIVTGRNVSNPRPVITYIGLGLSSLYVFLWMFNGKRSHSLFGVLTTLCAWYCSRGKRPSFLTLGVVAFLGAVAVTLAIGWRVNPKYERSAAGFVEYMTNFNPADILVNINVGEHEETGSDQKKEISHETEEYGGYLLMLDTVPFKSPYDYGSSYLRIFSTFIPRLVWPDKPYYGREEWVSAWIAGSEKKRDKTFTGPAIGILGATQLNGGAWGTFIVLAGLALLLRTSYEYFRRYQSSPWAQAWWALSFYNAWLMTVNDDPFVWFYYIYGFTILPMMTFLWVYNRMKERSGHAMVPTPGPPAWTQTAGTPQPVI